jgi:ribonuclease HI
MNLSIDMNIKSLHVRGDSDLIVSQVNKNFAAKNPRLKQYRDVIWDAMKRFDNFSIEAIPREENHLVDNLVHIRIYFTTFQRDRSLQSGSKFQAFNT